MIKLIRLWVLAVSENMFTCNQGIWMYTDVYGCILYIFGPRGEKNSFKKTAMVPMSSDQSGSVEQTGIRRIQRSARSLYKVFNMASTVALLLVEFPEDYLSSSEQRFLKSCTDAMYWPWPYHESCSMPWIWEKTEATPVAKLSLDFRLTISRLLKCSN